LLVQLFYSLVVAVRPGQAELLLPEVRRAVEQTGDSAARFILELGESALQYTRGYFGTSLTLADAALRSGAELGEDHRLWLARDFRSRILTVTDRTDEALAAATEGIRAAQQARQGRALHLFENNRGRQLLQAGNLADAAAALEGRFSPDDAHLVDGDSTHVRVQVLTNAGALDRDKQLAVVAQLTSIVAAAAADPSLAGRT
jgi:hypothetical protein